MVGWCPDLDVSISNCGRKLDSPERSGVIRGAEGEVADWNSSDCECTKLTNDAKGHHGELHRAFALYPEGLSPDSRGSVKELEKGSSCNYPSRCDQCSSQVAATDLPRTLYAMEKIFPSSMYLRYPTLATNSCLEP